MKRGIAMDLGKITPSNGPRGSDHPARGVEHSDKARPRQDSESAGRADALEFPPAEEDRIERTPQLEERVKKLRDEMPARAFDPERVEDLRRSIRQDDAERRQTFLRTALGILQGEMLVPPRDPSTIGSDVNESTVS